MSTQPQVSLSHGQQFDESRLLLLALIENMQAGTLFEDMNRRIVLANNTFCTMFGIRVAPNSLIGEDCRMMAQNAKASTTDPDGFLRRIEEIVQRGSVVTRDELHLLDGRVFERDYSPIHMDGGQLGHLWQYRDITVRRRSEEALRKSEEENRAIVNAVPDMLFRLRRDGLFLDYHTPVNAALYAAPEVFLGKYITDILPKELAARAMAAIEQAFETQCMVTFDYSLSIGGREMYFEDRVLPLSNNEILSFIRDVSERVHSERQLVQAQKLEGIGTLAGGIAHEFNNLLAMILGSAELLRGHLGPESTLMKYVDRIIEASGRGAAISRQLLTFSRPEHHEMKAVSLRSCLGDLQKMLTYIIPDSIDVRMEIDASTDPIRGDAGQIQQALLNLVLNASDAMSEAGTIRIQVGNADPAIVNMKFGLHGGARYAAVSVSDTGIGMDEQTIKKIYDPFFSTKEKGKGTGLGLAIVHGIMKNHNGFIDVSSARGEGSTFTMYFPAMPAEALSDDDGHPDPVQVKPLTSILIVDDEEILRETLSEYFEGVGFVVHTASNGQEALAVYRDHAASIGLVLTDLGMPEMGGEELFRKLSAFNKDVKVIVSSGYLDGTTKERLLRLGIRDVVTKPFRIDAIDATVMAVLNSPS